MEFLVLPILIYIFCAAYLFASKPHLAIAIILVASMVNVLLFDKPLELGISVFTHDVVFIPLFFSAIYRIIFKGEFQYISILWCIYGLLLFYEAAIGVKMLGTIAAADFRTSFYYWTGTLYFMSFQYSEETIKKLIKYWINICLILLVVVYVRFVADFANLPIAQEWRMADTTGVRFRVINSGEAYLLSITILMLFHRYIQPKLINPSKVIIAFLVLAVIVLQHRSVWVATFMAIISAALLPGIKSSKVFSNLTVIILVGIILLLPLLYLGYADKFISSISDSAEKATSLTTGTFGGRVRGWVHVIDYWQNQSFLHQVFGDPFGTGYAGGHNRPHNFYFQALLRVGAFGAIILFFTYLTTMLKLYFKLRADKERNLYLSLFLMLLIGQQFFYIPYSFNAEHGIILGIAISLSKRKSLLSNKTNNNILVFGKPHKTNINAESAN